ncbi:DUF2490 domain-containing protein [uncultured Polaribacter sp.]|uniref:DUF2490 domain-containing protein n=1 Tax=uncultured Polaribacter sp. TaxID=174711 RepID=UPI00263616AE|nr:DUF2490 domain-containing protein [uncultured Polaribacter sp.]
MKEFLLMLSLILFLQKTQAQNSSENKLGAWYMYNGTHKISDKYSLKSAIHFRYFELISEYQQEIYRLGLNYKINNTVNATFGTVYSITDTSYKENLPNLYEYRFYQDLNVKDKWYNFKVTHRVRLAQRFRRQNFKNKTTHRIRYGLFLKHPISKKLTTYAFNEVFIKFATKAFGQNRTGIGLLQKTSDFITLKFGYMYTQFNSTQSNRLQLGLIVTTNHTKT